MGKLFPNRKLEQGLYRQIPHLKLFWESDRKILAGYGKGDVSPPGIPDRCLALQTPTNVRSGASRGRQ